MNESIVFSFNAFFRTGLSPSVLAHVSVIEAASEVASAPLMLLQFSSPGGCAPGSS